MLKEYPQFDATEIANLIRSKQISVDEALDAAIHQVEKYNPQLNAVVYKMYELAKKNRNNLNSDGPFAGVPFLIKDLGLDFEGTPTSGGSRLTQNYTSQQTSEIIHRYNRAGFITLGKTNVPEFGIMGVTESSLWGPCRNPWDLKLTPGGSSGGSASAVAARFVPIASADDGGGSIRIPASACGLFGVKPSRGVQPMGPDKNESWLSLVSGHVVSRTVRDSAQTLDLTKGPDLGAPYGPTRPFESCLHAMTKDLKGRKVAFSRQSLFGEALDKDCLEALDKTMKACESLGMEVVEDYPAFNKDELLFSYYVIIAASVAGEIARNEKLMGQKASVRNVEHATWFLKVAGEKLRASHLEQAIYNCRQTTILWEQFLTKYDYFSTPTMASAPSPIGLMSLSGVEKAVIQMADWLPLEIILSTLKKIGKRGIEKTPNTSLFNMSGHPAMSVPTHWNSANLPIGTQFVGRMGQDHTLFTLAAKLEDVFQWNNKQPDLIKNQT